MDRVSDRHHPVSIEFTRLSHREQTIVTYICFCRLMWFHSYASFVTTGNLYQTTKVSNTFIGQSYFCFISNLDRERYAQLFTVPRIYFDSQLPWPSDNVLGCGLQGSVLKLRRFHCTSLKKMLCNFDKNSNNLTKEDEFEIKSFQPMWGHVDESST